MSLWRQVAHTFVLVGHNTLILTNIIMLNHMGNKLLFFNLNSEHLDKYKHFDKLKYCLTTIIFV